jgi:hypothetical protein
MIPLHTGINKLSLDSLALCELTLCLTALVLRVLPHMRLHDTTLEDLAYDHDMFVPVTKDSRGVRVRIQ